MLNELAQVIEALDRVGLSPPPRHPRINPMGKNKDLLVVYLGRDAKPNHVEVLAGQMAAGLFRVEHGSAGSSFPGFNVPTPLRCLEEAPTEKLVAAVEHLLAANDNKKTSVHDLSLGAAALFKLSKPREFTASQKKQFQRSCGELVDELQHLMANAAPGLANFRSLLDFVAKERPTLESFAGSLAEMLAAGDHDATRDSVLRFQDILYGALDWKKRQSRIGTSAYWKEKAKQDKNANQPIYLDLASPAPRFKRVAHSETSTLINQALLLASEQSAEVSQTKGTSGTVDAFGQAGELQDKFPSPKVAELGNLKLFSVNTNEVRALARYGLEGAKAFPVVRKLAQRMSDALLYLAKEEQRGTTCRAIPSAHPDKRDLLVAYLEGEPEFRAQMAEMLGGEANAFSDADFAAVAQPVIELLEGKAAANPNLNVRLLAFCSIDKGRKQISLNRRFRVVDVIRAARDWQAGSQNVPGVSVWFYDKTAKQSVFRSHTTPGPLELAATVNRVWSSTAKGGFSSSFQRAMSAADAYDIFMADSPLSRRKAEGALSLLVRRMSGVLAALCVLRTTRNWTSLSDPVRWQSLKAIALLGILLRQLNEQHSTFMKEPVYQLGQLLALADSLHQQYCKHVRGDESPTQLIGNSLFSTALEQPVFALARLAERLAPYQAWAKTFKNTDPNVKSGWEKVVLGLLRDCASRFVEEVDGVFRIRADELPARMSDLDKAKLLLGYLADTQHPKPEDN
jgi:hypothetical protein